MAYEGYKREIRDIEGHSTKEDLEMLIRGLIQTIQKPPVECADNEAPLPVYVTPLESFDRNAKKEKSVSE